MKIAQPVALTTSMLTASNVAETEADWSGATTYALNAEVKAAPAGINRRFKSLQGPNLNHAVTETAWWADLGPTARWRPFDGAISVQAQAVGTLTYTFQVPGRIDTVAALNVNAQNMRVVQTDAVDGVLFDETISMISDLGITDVYRYFLEPIQRVPNQTVTGLQPLYSDTALQVTLTDPGETVGLGELVVGLSLELGGTRWNPKIELVDYSTKEDDGFGGFKVLERPYAFRGAYQIWVEDGFAATLFDTLARYRAKPLLFIGDPARPVTHLYGYFSDLVEEISYPDRTLCSLIVNGLG